MFYSDLTNQFSYLSSVKALAHFVYSLLNLSLSLSLNQDKCHGHLCSLLQQNNN